MFIIITDVISLGIYDAFYAFCQKCKLIKSDNKHMTSLCLTFLGLRY